MSVHRVPRDTGQVISGIERRLNRLELRARGFSVATPASGVSTYPSDEPPTGTFSVGDLWFDTNDGNRIYRWDGTGWVSMLGNTPDRARDRAAAALVYWHDEEATADNLVTTHVRAGLPSGPLFTGDLWIDTDDNLLYRWSGSAWVSTGNTEVGALVTKQENRISYADGRIPTYWQFSEPTATGFGDLWVATSQAGNPLFRWDNFDWVRVLDWSVEALQDALETKISTYYEATPPVARAIGDLWYNTAEQNVAYRAEAVGASTVGPGAWVLVRDEGVVDALDAANEAVTVAESKNSVYNQPNEPVGGTYSIGDLWYDTDDGYRPYVWDGTLWTSARDQGLSDEITAAVGAIEGAASDAQAATEAAAAALEAAEERSRTFYQATAPVAPGVSNGDLWFDTANGYRQYIRRNNEWVSVQDAAIAEAAAEAAGAASVADDAIELAATRNRTFYEAEPPAATAAGDLWFDTDDGYKQYRWDGSQWLTVRDALIAEAAAAAAGAATVADNALSTANGRNRIFYEPTAPVANAIGDLWFDTSNGYRQSIWNGTAWVDAQDAAIAEAAAAAAGAAGVADDALLSANGKNRTFYEAEPPIATAAGDLWFDTDAGYEQYRWSGHEWVSVQDALIAETASQAANAVSVAETAAETANQRNRTFFAPEPPVATAVGDLWFDTDDGHRQYRWNGTTWVDVRDAGVQAALEAIATKSRTFYEPSPPTATAVGDLWFDTDDGYRQYRWDGFDWRDVQDVAITGAAEAAQSAIGLANDAAIVAARKNAVFFQPDAPPAANRKTGDIWFDTDQDNKIYQWSSGSESWLPALIGSAAIGPDGILGSNIQDGAITNSKIGPFAIAVRNIISRTHQVY